MSRAVLTLVALVGILLAAGPMRPAQANSFFVDLEQGGGIFLEDFYGWLREDATAAEVSFSDPTEFSYTQFSAMPATVGRGDAGASVFTLQQFVGNPCLPHPAGTFTGKALIVSQGLMGDALNISLPLPCPADTMFRNLERAGAGAILASPSVVTSALDGASVDSPYGPDGSGSSANFDPLTGAPIINSVDVNNLVALSASEEYVGFGAIAVVMRETITLEGELFNNAPLSVRVTFTQQALIASELNALRALYVGLNGPGWTWDSGTVNGVPWLFRDNADPCRDNWARVVCSTDGYVDQLLLSQMNLIGDLPAAIGGFGQISLIDLSENRVSGSLPSTVGQWKRLRYLSLAENSITGSGLPSSWRTLQSIEVLDLSGNLFSGVLSEYPFPPNTTVIRMDRNNLTGGIFPDMSRFVALSEFRVAGNSLSGILPVSFFTTLKVGLSVFDVAGNSLVGVIPSAMYTTVKYADLSLNDFTVLPPPLSPCTIEYLFLGGNELTALPDFDLFGQLVSLDVSFNSLSGLLKPIKAASLKTLSVSGNSLSGLSGSFAAFYENEESVDFYTEGEDPAGALFEEGAPAYNGTGLVVFEGSGNQFVSLRDLLLRLPTTLSVLDLSFNKLEYPLPQLKLGDFGIFSSLQKLDLSNNKLSALLKVSQSDASSLSLLSEFDISENEMYGPVSELLGSLVSLRRLDLSGNNFTRLAGPGSLVPTFMVPNYVSVTTTALDGAACPTFQNAAGTLDIAIDHTYHGFLLCTCLDGFYNTSAGTCEPCLSNAKCVGYPTQKTESRMTPLSGYYPIEAVTSKASPYAVPSAASVNASVEAQTRRVGHAGSGRVLSQSATVSADGATVVVRVPAVMKGCEFGAIKATDANNPCVINSNGEFACKEGHQGRLCSACSADYFSQDGECIKCKDSDGLWPVIFVIFTLVVIVASGAIAGIRDTIPHIERLYTPMIGVRACLAKRSAVAAGAATDTGSSFDNDNEYTYAYAYAYSEEEEEEEASSSSSGGGSEGKGKEEKDVDPVDPVVRKQQRRELRLYVQSVIQVSINFFQTLAICIADLSIPSAAIPVLAVSEFTKTSSEGIGLECFAPFRTFYTRYVSMCVLPLIVMVTILGMFSLKFVLRFAQKAVKHGLRSARDALGSSGSSGSGSLDYEYGYDEEQEARSESLSLIVGSSSDVDGGDGVGGDVGGGPVMPSTPRSAMAIYWGQVVYVVFLTLNYFFFPITTFVLDVFNCEEDPVTGTAYMVSYPALGCNYLTWWEKAIPLFAYVLLPVIVLLFVMVWLEVYGTNFVINTSFGFWLDAYRSSRRFFSVVFLLRRFFLAIVVTFLDVKSLERHVIVFGILIVSVVLDYEVAPFFYHRTTTVDVMAHVMLIVVYATGLLADLLDVEKDSAKFASSVLIGCMVFGGLILVWAILLPIWVVFVRGDWHDDHARAKHEERTRAEAALQPRAHDVVARQ